MTHNENIKTFEDLSLHLELVAERLEAVKANGLSYTAQFDSRKPSRPKRKKKQGGKYENFKPAPEKANSTKRKGGKCGVRRVKLAQRTLAVVKKNTSLVIALSRRRYSLI